MVKRKSVSLLLCHTTYLSHAIQHQLFSIAFATYKNIRNPNSLSKCRNEPLDVTKSISNFLQSLNISLSNTKIP